MCAINGLTWKDEALAQQMNAVTKHRGPDGSQIWSDNSITFGHNRLAIIDPSNSSDQPMKSKDGRFVMIYNGELYNFKELKKELGESRFRTSGDTEVVLEAYQEWGAKCLDRFNGMFALAIWDTREKSLFLARDHAGIKPLYYYHAGSELVFSSEVKGILSYSKVSRAISTASLNHFLRLLYVPEPLTMLETVFKLPQGSFAIFKNGTLSIEKYYHPGKAEVDSLRAEQHRGLSAEQRIEKTIDEAVERQLVSDRPLGVYLSGGIDSSIILDSMSNKHDKIKTYSVGFDLPGADASKYNFDFDLARRTAAHYKTDHHEVRLSSDEVLKNFRDVVWQLDEPISNPTAWALFALSKITKPTATVVLSGDGGDELFGGYERYRMAWAAHYYHLLPKALTNSLAPVSTTLAKLAEREPVDRYAQFMFQKEELIGRVLKENVFEPAVTHNLFVSKFKSDQSRDFEAQFMDTDRTTWLTDFALMISDTMSMAHGVEARVPFLDKEVMELALSIPANRRLSLFGTKRLLKQAFAKRLPEYLFEQPKRGFFAPAAKWLRHSEFLAMARNVLSPGYCTQTEGFFDWKAITNILESHVAGTGYNLSIIWALLTFQVWARQLFDAKIAHQ